LTDTSLFGETPPENKYDSWDIEALKKKAEAADNHIRTLEAEAANRREITQNTATVEELIRRLDQSYQPPVTPPTPVVNPTTVQPTTISEQISKQDVINILEQKQKESQAKANVDKIRKELHKVWGDTFPTRLSEKSKALGVSETFLATMAESYPDAFIKLVVDEKPITNPNAHVAPTSTRTVNYNITGDTRKDFRAAEKANPSLLNDPAFQKRKHEAAARLGDAFFN
jgi:hypothetical protein